MKIFKNTAIFTIITILSIANLYAQSDFATPNMIRNYLKSHLSSLNPIEGEYDVDWSCSYDTPLGHWDYPHDTFKLWIVKQNGVFAIYSNPDNRFSKSRILKVSQIGETNAYTLYYHTTPCRIIFNNNHFIANFRLNNQSADVFRGQSTAPSVKIAPSYDCIKTYPTAKMYAEEYDKRNQEEQVTEWSGTGFALKDGYIITNYHVVEGAKSITIQGVKGSFNPMYHATIVGADKNNDLALLKITDSAFSGFGTIPYSIATASSDVGENIYVLGYPLTSTMGDELKLTTGVISSKSGFQGDVSMYQISAPIQPGNSGGPLFDNKGNVIGIVSAKHKGAENVGYAVKTSYLRNLVESYANSSIIPSTNTVSMLPLTGKVKNERNFVFYIKCSSNQDNLETLGERVIYNPLIGNDYLDDMAHNTQTHISEIRLSSSRTAITLCLSNYAWCSISQNTFIQAGTQRYKIISADGIEFSPNKTYPSRDKNGIAEKIKCTLFFPAIPHDIKSIDLIEPNSRWQFFNVKLLGN